ncbi:heterokaryon incompatibility protein domain-containing protein [Trichoderma evansii]
MSANQSRRRIDLDQGPESSTKSKIDNTLPYQKEELDDQNKKLDDNSVRLVQIQSAANESDPVVCTLIEVPFGSRPKFKALSYMWGTDKENDTITLNGFPFEVRKNLLDALLFLRSRAVSEKGCQLFWIDAICINQSDVEERNRQLKIMPQIYFRASTVVVWLGSKYAKFQKEMIQDLEIEEGEKPEKDHPKGSNITQQKMVEELQNDPYWNRLWIRQEIGLAKELQVCFGNRSLPWDNFMLLIAMHNGSGSTGPLMLDKSLRQERYNDSHTLKKLLENHVGAECSDPRDKVYGLVGLASDAAQFPMDYNKSLYDVWEDTMAFMNRWGLFQDESQIVQMGKLLKCHLMANNNDPLSQISKDHEHQANPNPIIGARVFRFRAVLLGCIVCVGPSAREVVSRPDETMAWKTAIQRLFPATELGSAHQEYDRLLRVLLESDESKLRRCASIGQVQSNGRIDGAAI